MLHSRQHPRSPGVVVPKFGTTSIAEKPETLAVVVMMNVVGVAVQLL